MYCLSTLLILMYIFKTQCQQENGTLILINEVFRHGARESVWTEYDSPLYKIDSGEITPAGIRMHYILGQALKKQYIDTEKFISPVFNQSEFIARSTDVNRTIMSAYSQLYGLFPVGTGPTISTVFNMSLALPPWPGAADQAPDGEDSIPNQVQPIPVHVLLESNDPVLLGYSSSNCPNAKQWDANNYNTPMHKQLEVLLQPTAENFAKVMNVSVSTATLDYMAQAYDVFVVDYYQGRALPDIGPDLLKNLSFCWTINIYLNLFQDFYQTKVMSSPFFEELFTNIQNAVQMTSPKKWYLYSAHDTTVALLLSALNLSNTDCIYQSFVNPQYSDYCITNYPGFASNIIFELRQLETTYYIYIRYNGTYQPIKVCGGKYRCEYQNFMQQIRKQMMDYNKECGVQDNTQTKYVYKYKNPAYAWVILSILIVFSISLIIWFIMIKKAQQKLNQNGYQMENENKV